MQEFFSFEGRINRAKYFGYQILASVILAIFQGFFGYTGSFILTTINVFLSVIAFVFSVCITVQRFHDLDRPGTHWWLLLVPFYNIYLAFVLLLKKGTDGSNRYGEDPLQ